MNYYGHQIQLTQFIVDSVFALQTTIIYTKYMFCSETKQIMTHQNSCLVNKAVAFVISVSVSGVLRSFDDYSLVLICTVGAWLHVITYAKY